MSVIYRNDHAFVGPISMLRKLANGELVLVFREAMRRDGPSHADPTTRTSLIRSSDNGHTWHSQVTPDPAGGNGTTVTQLRDGSLLVSCFHWLFVPLAQKDTLEGRGKMFEYTHLGLATAIDGIYTARSDTDGHTWQSPRRIETGDLQTPATAGRVIELRDGSLLMPITGKQPGASASRCRILRSRDQATTWEDTGEIGRDQGDLDLQEPRLAILPDGTIIAMMRIHEGNFYQAFSSDGGASWSSVEPTPIPCNSSSPGDLLLLKDGRLLCTYGRRTPPYGVRACLSPDNGRTWDMEHEIVLRDDGPDRDMGYPCTEQLGDTTMLSVYYWHGMDGVRYLESSLWSLPA